MFGKENQYGMVASFNVRVKDEREKDRNHLVEVTFELPLTFDLADEISPAIAKDLFDKVKGDWAPKPEISSLVMNLSPETQLMTVRTHPELEADVKIAGVNLRKIQAKKVEAGAWALAFTATWTLGDPKEAITMIQRLKQGVYLTLVTQAPSLLDQPQLPAGDGQDATVDVGGNVTSIKKGRRRRKTPEQEGADQEAAAREQLPEGDGGDESTDGDEAPATH